jgi:hypothetical protein
MTVTEEINAFIETNTNPAWGSILGYVRTRDALNIALARMNAAEARAAQLEAERDALRRQLEQAQAALLPFTHIDLIKKLAGNEQGEESIVYQRNDAVLTLGDFRRAYRLFNPVATR